MSTKCLWSETDNVFLKAGLVFWAILPFSQQPNEFPTGAETTRMTQMKIRLATAVLAGSLLFGASSALAEA
ncbi:hypothetical protein, partial [Agrobacterium vitis]|uniref:hypothetical protein n=1 Tax=Agrobacterium vitis TaxID=373 RepID=UPI001AEE2BCD